MPWLFLVILSAFSGSLARIFQKLLLKEKDSDPFAFAFVFQTIIALMFFSYTFFTGTFHLPSLADLILNVIAMGLLYSLGNLFVFKAFKLAEASEVSVIFASNTLWSVIAAIFLLGEKLDTRKVIGIILIVAGLVSLNYVKSKWKLNRGHAFGLLGAMFFGFGFTNDAFIINRFNSVASYMVLAFILPGVITLSFKPKSVKNIAYFIRGQVLGKLLVCCFFYFLAAFTIFEAYKGGGQA